MGWEVDLERDEFGGEGRLWGETGGRGELQSGCNTREKNKKGKTVLFHF